MKEVAILMRVKGFKNILSPELQGKFDPIGKKIVDNYNRPFYEWKIRSQQNKDIKDILENANNTDHKMYKVLFCIYVAEWIKYKHDGGQIRWDNIIDDVDGLDDFDTTRAVRDSFCFLGRDIIPEKYLYTLARESGFPINLLKQDKYRRVFKNLLDDKPSSNIPDMYADDSTQSLWAEIARGLMDLEYSQNSEVLEGLNFRYYDIDQGIRNWLSKTQRATQENKVKINFTLERVGKSDDSMSFEIHKKIKAPQKINGNTSQFIEIKVAKYTRSAWWDKSDYDETIKPIQIGNTNECVEPVYVHIGDDKIPATESPFNAMAGADLTRNIVYFIATKQPDVFTFHKTGYSNKKDAQDMYALYPEDYILKPSIECVPYDIFDGYKIIHIQGDIDFFDGETQVGGVSDEYKDITLNNGYKGDIFYHPNIQIGTQGYAVYKGLPRVHLGNSVKDFTHYRYDKKSDITPIKPDSVILGRVELFYVSDNKRKASLVCIVLPTDFEIPICKDIIPKLPECMGLIWTDENEKPIYTVDGSEKSSSKIKMKLNGKTVPVLIDWVKYENAFYKRSENGDDIKLDNGDTISLWDIHEGAYVKPCDDEQEIIINDNCYTTKKIPHKRRFDLCSIIHTIRDELLLGYTDDKNQAPIKIAIGEEHSSSEIKIDSYHYRISVNSDDKCATIICNSANQDIPISENDNLQFICFQDNKVIDVSCYEIGYYDLKSIQGKGAGILYVQNTNHIKSAFYANDDNTDICDNDLKSIIIKNKNNRVLNIAKHYSKMIQNPNDYGIDWKYLETLLTAVDEGIPVWDMDAFKAWYKCPDIVPALYGRYLDDTKMQNRIKKVMKGNGFLNLISYVAYKSLYQKTYCNLKDKKVSHIMSEYNLIEKDKKIYELYKINNDSGLEKDCVNEAEKLMLHMFDGDKIIYRLLHNNSGKNYLKDDLSLNHIHSKKETWICRLQHNKIYADELKRVIDCFVREKVGHINSYTEQDFIQCNRLYNYTFEYEKKKLDFVDRMADILKMNELEKEKTENE